MLVTARTSGVCIWFLQVTSGHADHYKDNMFQFEIEKQLFGLKPMNCPGGCTMWPGSLLVHTHQQDCLLFAL
jgi:hypothetical protein